MRCFKMNDNNQHTKRAARKREEADYAKARLKDIKGKIDPRKAHTIKYIKQVKRRKKKENSIPPSKSVGNELISLSSVDST